MAIQCENVQNNLDRCPCTYVSCGKRGNCCDCISYHLAMQELPGCCFPANVEKTYDRSFKKFVEVWGAKLR